MLQSGMMIAERYEIVDTVGAGGMSVVYKAMDHRLNRYVAVKVLKEEYSDDKTFVNKFRVEAQSAAGLSHPNIVNVYDVGDDEGIHFIVMEMVEGITLKEYIEKKGHLSVSEAVNFSLQIASGIEVAHDNHIIHRDIKPQNIIVNSSGILKVTDFGIAKAATSATVSSNAIGSVHYISPEQARGGFSDERSDIYSLGITMYEMVTGRVPFEGDNNVAVALMHIQNEMISPREYYPDILPSFEKVIAKCTQKKPERRYLTANALIADLRRVESDPMGNFVKEVTLIDGSPTRMMDDEELGAIKAGMNNTPAAADYQQTSYEEDYEPDVADEGEEEEDMDPKLEKLAKILGVVAAVVVVLLIIFLIALAAGGFGGKKKPDTTEKTPVASSDATTEGEKGEEAELPSVLNDDIDMARQTLNDAGFNNIKVEYEESETVEENKVISMTPNAGETVNMEEEIKLLVSSGKSSVKVPNVVNYKSDAAEKLLQQDGFVVKYAYDYSDTVDEGKVIKQDPGAGMEASEGATVTITVSQGKEVSEVPVPNVVGMTEKEAAKELEKYDLKYSLTKANSDTYDKGEIIHQSPEAGTKVKSGDVIDLTISAGPAASTTYSGSYTVPDLLGEGVDNANMKIYLNSASNPIYDITVTHDNFPFTVNVENSKSSTAKITVYIDDVQKGSYSFGLKASK